MTENTNAIFFRTNTNILLVHIIGKLIIFGLFTFLELSFYDVILNSNNVDPAIWYGLVLISILSLYLIIMIVSNIVTLFYAKANYLSVDDKFLTKQFNGKTEIYELSKIKEVKNVQIVGSNRPIPILGKAYLRFNYDGKSVKIGDGDFYSNFNSFKNILTTKLYD